MKSSVNSEPTSTSTPPISWPSVNGHGSFFGQCPLRMCRSVPQTPHAPTLISAAFFGIFGHGTSRMTGRAPGPSYVHTRIWFMIFLRRGCDSLPANSDHVYARHTPETLMKPYFQMYD